MTSHHPVRRVLRKAVVPAVSAATALGLTLTLAGPAAANGTYSGRAYVYGAGTVLDDLNNEGVVSQTTNRVSNATCMWQTILYANGYLPASEVDGAFGPTTAAATKKFQRDKGITADGSAGRNTWKKAGTRVFDGGPQADGWHFVIYKGINGASASYTARQVTFQRDPSGNYRFYPPNYGSRLAASYNTRTC
jgi:hypothetical protein